MMAKLGDESNIIWGQQEVTWIFDGVPAIRISPEPG